MRAMPRRLREEDGAGPGGSHGIPLHSCRYRSPSPPRWMRAGHEAGIYSEPSDVQRKDRALESGLSRGWNLCEGSPAQQPARQSAVSS